MIIVEVTVVWSAVLTEVVATSVGAPLGNENVERSGEKGENSGLEGLITEANWLPSLHNGISPMLMMCEMLWASICSRRVDSMPPRYKKGARSRQGGSSIGPVSVAGSTILMAPDDDVSEVVVAWAARSALIGATVSTR